MSTFWRLSLACVAVSLLSTLALLPGGDSSGNSSLLARVSSWLEGGLGDSDVDPLTTDSKTGQVVAKTLSPSPLDDDGNSNRSSPIRQAMFLNNPASDDPGGQRADEQPFDQAKVKTPLAAANSEHDSIAPGRTLNGIDVVVRDKDITYVLDLLSITGRRKIVPSQNVKGQITIALYDTTVEQALDAILKMRGLVKKEEGDFVYVYTAEDLEELETNRAKPVIWIYKPRYISSNDLMQVLTPHLSTSGKISSTKSNSIGIGANGESAGGDSIAVADALVVKDKPPYIEELKRIAEQIDVRPQQVLIEAVLLSVELNNDHKMGVNFALLSGKASLTVAGNGSAINGAAGFAPSTLVSAGGKVQGGFASNEHGLKYGVIDGNLTGFVNLLETVGHTTIVASPKVMALNKQRAEIIIGSQLGYRTVTTTETASVESVQFLDVGTQLRMRPFVQSDGRIRMELHPEKSSGKISETTGLPQKDTNQVTTNLTVMSGTTIVIGGLIEEQQQRTVQQIPFLGSLPFVGGLFRDEGTSVARKELIVLVTPRIIDEDEEAYDAQRKVNDFAKRRDGLETSFPRHTRLAMARKHLDMAWACYEQGDMKAAREMVDLALHFDPLNESALRLLDELRMPAESDVRIAPPTDMYADDPK